MDRRTLLTAGGAAAALTLTGAGVVTEPVFEWSQPGGFFPPGQGVFVPPMLAVYADRTAYADATASFRLSGDEVGALRDHALRALTAHREPRPGDVPVDSVRVRRPDGGWTTARVEAWGDPGDLAPLRRRVQRLRDRVLRTGEPWRPNALLLATVRLGHLPDRYRDWPEEVPPPPAELYGETRIRGAGARAVRRVLPAATGRVWPMYRAGGSFYAATWRHLLPHE